MVDDSTVSDPRNTYNSPMIATMYSLVEVPAGADDVQTYHAGIPHGAVLELNYDSAVAGPHAACTLSATRLR